MPYRTDRPVKGLIRTRQLSWRTRWCRTSRPWQSCYLCPRSQPGEQRHHRSGTTVEEFSEFDSWVIKKCALHNDQCLRECATGSKCRSMRSTAKQVISQCSYSQLDNGAVTYLKPLCATTEMDGIAGAGNTAIAFLTEARALGSDICNISTPCTEREPLGVISQEIRVIDTHNTRHRTLYLRQGSRTLNID